MLSNLRRKGPFTMAVISEGSGARACWFVGYIQEGKHDQLSRFVEEGIWENSYLEKYADLIKSVRPGDAIAMKACYTRKNDLPFDNRGHIVAVMGIKAIGKVAENPGDGCSLKVDWEPLISPREWYFYTCMHGIWRVVPGDWYADALIAFAFEGKNQNIDRFRNAPYWRERFGDAFANKQDFRWTRFYEALADALLTYRGRREELVAKIHEIASRLDCLPSLQDTFQDGSIGSLRDICPFTIIGLFNRGITDANRKLIARELAGELGISEPVPESFWGIPVVDNRKSRFFGPENKRQPDDIDALWNIFSQALLFAESDDENVRSSFVASYSDVARRHGVGWNLTMGLYWIRPWNFPTLDAVAQRYLKKKLGMSIPCNGPKGRCNGKDYLEIFESLEARFQEETYPVHSFPELSLAAWLFKDDEDISVSSDNNENDEMEIGLEGGENSTPPIEPYSMDSILEEGCFLDREELVKILDRLRAKKNLILQGPPGTGKTWLSKRLAFALLGEKDDSRVRGVQFHPNLSYEDFVRGWRPEGDGKLALVDGPFMEMVGAAKEKPAAKYVMVIEEINRGNPAQIFGEMLTLLEGDKRTPGEALELCYSRGKGERIFIPANLYIIGTMNIADRSLALVDLALRRRFAFISLEPVLVNLGTIG